MKFFLIRIPLLIVFGVLLYIVIAFARGYRLDLTERTVGSTGILVASSYPDGAKIMVNGELEGATNSNVGVKPGVYDIEITKDGFLPWKKTLTIKGELVIKADALLFPLNPSLSPVTSLGIVKAVVSNSHEKIVILADSDDIEKDGLYILGNGRIPLTRVNSQRLIVLKSALPGSFETEDIQVEFSPDEGEILISLFGRNSQDEVSETPYSVYLLPTDSTTERPFAVTQSVEAIREAWVEEQAEITQKQLETLEPPLPSIARESFHTLAFSPDETKIMYAATASASLPLIIDPPLIAANQTPEQRNIEPGNLYIYDSKEDKNFQLNLDDFDLETITESVFWYVDSAHLVIKENDKLAVIDYDGSNRRTVYSGPFEQNFAAVGRDGKLLILTNFNSQTAGLPDVYSVGIR